MNRVPESRVLREVAELLSSAIDGEIDGERFDRLEKLLHESAFAREHYFDLLLTAIGLDEIEQMLDLRAAEGSVGRYDADLWQAVADSEKTAPIVHIENREAPSQPSAEPLPADGPRSVKRVSHRTLVLTTFMAIAFLVALYFASSPRSIVATLSDAYGAEWMNTENTVPTKGDVLRQGEFVLSKGWAQITFDDGAVAVFEGPAVFNLQSPGSMLLAGGQVSVFVPEYATGFTINTFSGRIVALGTEFGVKIESDGSCSLHMFKGKARLTTAVKNGTRTSELVGAKQARRMSALTGNMEVVQLEEAGFVRCVDSGKSFVWRGEALNLADVISGGSGFGTPASENGIDPVTGESHARVLREERQGTGGYVPVPHLPYVDGVFTLAGEKEVMQVSTGKQEFEFEQNAAKYWTDITTGGEERKSLLNGINYGVEQPYLYMRPNMGITFDLQMMRKDMPGLQLAAFVATVGCSARSQAASVAHFWVLVDGKLRWKSDDMTRDTGGVDINVLLYENERFLTLATTDGGDGWEDDWCMYDNPELILELHAPTGRPH